MLQIIFPSCHLLFIFTNFFYVGSFQISHTFQYLPWWTLSLSPHLERLLLSHGYININSFRLSLKLFQLLVYLPFMLNSREDSGQGLPSNMDICFLWIQYTEYIHLIGQASAQVSLRVVILTPNSFLFSNKFIIWIHKFLDQ